VTGESLGQARIQADLARQHASQNLTTVHDIERSYVAQIAALSHPRRTMTCPD
jgi:hypothetical protein